jgi:hypothetical protein
MLDRDAERRTVAFGWALFALFVAIFVGSVGVALLYLALD